MNILRQAQTISKNTAPKRLLSSATSRKLFTALSLMACLIFLHHSDVSALSLDQDSMRFDRLLTEDDDNDGWKIGEISTIKQDSVGFFWFVGKKGIVRYDSHEYKYYFLNDPEAKILDGNQISDLIIDKNNEMWAATSNGLKLYNRDKDRFDSFEIQSPINVRKQFISALAVDNENNLYICTRNGLYILDSERSQYEHFTHQSNISHSISSNMLTSIHVDRRNNVWVGTLNNGLNLFRPETKTFRRWAHNLERDDSLPSHHIHAVDEDHLGRLWVATADGVARLNTDGYTFTNFRHDASDSGSISSNDVRDIELDSDNRLWFATDHGGLALFDPTEESFTHFKHNVYDPQSLSSNQLRHVTVDSQGNMWVGTFPRGINFFDNTKSVFKPIQHKPDNPNTLSHNSILSIFEDSDGILWIGTEDGLNRVDKRNNTTTRFTRESVLPQKIDSDIILSIDEDPDGSLWLGTWGGGLYNLDRKTYKFKTYTPDPDNEKSLLSRNIWSVEVDHNGEVWVGCITNGGLQKYNKTHDNFDHVYFLDDDKATPITEHIRDILVDENNVVWLASHQGLGRLRQDNLSYQVFSINENKDTKYTSNDIRALFKDSRGTIWMGTNGGGIRKLLKGHDTLLTYTIDDGLPSNNVASFTEDTNGHIWATTYNGVVRINPQNMQFKLFNVSNGLVGNMHNRNAALLDRNGIVYLGSTRGVSAFDPKAIIEDDTPPAVVFTRLKIFNQEISPETTPERMAKTINQTEEIILNYNETTFTIEFSVLSYRSPFKNRFRYKLEGFDTHWNGDLDRGIATYTNIPPGEYTLLIAGSNSNQIWSQTEKSLRITITPPIWKTPAAYIIYIVMSLVSVFLIRVISLRIKRKKERFNADIDKKMAHLDKLKNTFITNTSHEFRTPLNAVIGITETLLQHQNIRISSLLTAQVNIVLNNGKRLSSLIDDIIDVSKVLENRLELHRRATALGPIVDDVIAIFQHDAALKEIPLKNFVAEQAPPIFVDPNRIHQILRHLLSNAIKYSNDGCITISSTIKDDVMSVSVKDQGIGMKEESLESIFDAFDQVDISDSRANMGAGIGLALTKSLIELHGGELNVQSAIGIGSNFTFTLPLATQKQIESTPSKSENSHSIEESRFSDSLFSVEKSHSSTASSKDSKNLKQIDSTEEKTESNTQNNTDTKNAGIKDNEKIPDDRKRDPRTSIKILIVDDDAVNRLVLRGVLNSQNFTVIEATSGQEALKQLGEHNDISMVILDYMMPVMSGLETCVEIRKTHAKSDLPVIFLSAKNTEDTEECTGAAGGNGFYQKPIIKDQFLPIVLKHLEDALRKR